MKGEAYKETLKKDSAKYQLALEQEIDKLINSSKSTVRNVLIIGGTLTFTYWLLKKALKPGKQKRKKPANNSVLKKDTEHSPTIFENISEIALRELSVFLLTYAKGKILDYIDTINEDDE